MNEKGRSMNEAGVKVCGPYDLLPSEKDGCVDLSNGDKVWYADGKLHREDGPAFEGVNGDREWFLDGKLHREDGPAIEWIDGTNKWYLYGKELTEKQVTLVQK